jgi:intein/homing endonuclease
MINKEQLYTSTQTKLLHNLDNLKTMQRGVFKPISIQLAPTDTCNLNCIMCSVKEREGNELTLEQCIQTLTNFKDLGAKTVEFSLHEDEVVPFKDANGYLKVDTIKHIVQNKEAFTSYTLAADNTFKEGLITDFVSHKQTEPLYKVTLSDGRNITVTKSHSIFFYKNNSIVYFPVKEATLDDVVVLLNKKPTINTINENPDFCRLLGYFVAEGSYQFQREHVPQSIVFTFGYNVAEQKYINDVVNILKSLNYKPIVTTMVNKTRISVHSKKLVELFLTLDVGEGSNNRRVPNLIFNVSDENKIEFLKGLFAGDGNFRNNLYKNKFFRRSLHLKTSSKMMQKTLIYLLDLLDVISTCACGTNLERRIEERTLKPSVYYTVSISNINSLVKVESIIIHMGKELVRSISKYSQRSIGTKKVYINDDCYGLKIKKIEELPIEDTVVYDLSVADTHRFEASYRILCHNTGGGDPTMYKHINEIITCAYDLGYGIGLITNGVKLSNILPVNLAKLTWLRISLNCLDYVEDIDIQVPVNVTLGFSYVWTDLSDGAKLEKIAKYYKKYNAAYVRVVPNCLSIEDISKATEAVKPFLNEYPRILFSTEEICST